MNTPNNNTPRINTPRSNTPRNNTPRSNTPSKASPTNTTNVQLPNFPICNTLNNISNLIRNNIRTSIPKITRTNCPRTNTLQANPPLLTNIPHTLRISSHPIKFFKTLHLIHLDPSITHMDIRLLPIIFLLILGRLMSTPPLPPKICPPTQPNLFWVLPTLSCTRHSSRILTPTSKTNPNPELTFGHDPNHRQTKTSSTLTIPPRSSILTQQICCQLHCRWRTRQTATLWQRTSIQMSIFHPLVTKPHSLC
mmetsp:Transcript_30203/g.41811  ORF Transcript_30203/g.41811 Transcript_30203/m.41811 type:complete len:251 (-) Transcript_30203:656-1408(-)